MPYTVLRYHLIIATYKRYPLITAEIEPVLYSALHAKASVAGGKVLQIGGIADHVHIVMSLKQTRSISDFLRVLKSGSCLAVRTRFGRESFRWQAKYGILTVSPKDVNRVVRYVRHQKKHHDRHETWPLYERLSRS